MATDRELKPCPFCGSVDAPMLEESNYPNSYRVVCDANNHGCGGSGGYKDGDASVKAWNTRNNNAVLDEVKEAVIKAKIDKDSTPIHNAIKAIEGLKK